MKQLKKFIKKAEYWFKEIGPFVYPEDDETWDSFKNFMLNAEPPYENFDEE